MLSGASFFVVKGFANQNKSAAVEKKKPSLNSLLKNGDYDVAAKYYPKQVEKIDNELIDSQVDDKAYFTKKIYATTHSPIAKFDNSYFTGEYQELVDTFDSAQKENIKALNQDTISNKRRLMLAYSCMKIGKFDEAKDFAEPLKSEDFTKRIKVYEKFYKANQILKDKLLNKKLSDNKKDKILEQIDKNNEILDKL